MSSVTIAYTPYYTTDVTNEVLTSVKFRHRSRSERFLWFSHGANVAMIFQSQTPGDSDKRKYVVENDEIFILCTGEIYNSTELIQKHNLSSDECKTSSSLLHSLYQKYKLEFLDQLDGEFVIFIYDKVLSTIHVARDHIGVQPLFVGRHHRDRDIILFSTEIHPLVSKCDMIRQFRPNSVWSNTGPSTFGKVIRETKIINETPYSNLISTGNKMNTLPDIMKRIRTLLVRSIKYRVMSQIPTGVILDGKLDTSLIAILLYKISPNIHIFTAGIKGSKEITIAKKLVAHFKINPNNHHVIEFTNKDIEKILPSLIKNLATYDVETVRTAIPHWFAAEYARKRTDTRIIIYGTGNNDIYGIKTKEENYRYSLDRVCHYELLAIDRVYGAHGIEVRLPLSSKKFISFMTSVPEEFKIPAINGFDKDILDKSLSGCLPTEIKWISGREGLDTTIIDAIGIFADGDITDEEWKNRKRMYLYNTPDTKEGYLYRRYFEREFRGLEMIVPLYGSIPEEVKFEPIKKVVKKVVEKVVEKPVEKPVEKVVEKVVEKPVEKVVEKVVEKPVEKVIEKPVEKVVEKPVVEKVIKKGTKEGVKKDTKKGTKKGVKKDTKKGDTKGAKKPVKKGTKKGAKKGAKKPVKKGTKKGAKKG